MEMRASVFGPLLALGMLCSGMTPAAAGELIVVKIAGLDFSPVVVKARVGDTIEWVNTDFIDHTATADDESFDLTIGAGKSARLKVMGPGAITYFCRVHPNMKGTLDVD